MSFGRDLQQIWNSEKFQWGVWQPLRLAWLQFFLITAGWTVRLLGIILFCKILGWVF